MPELAAWDNFYILVGSAAGALIGLQFVVMTLIAQRPPPRTTLAAMAFSTPTVVHFSTVLLLSALYLMPWQGLIARSAFWGLIGICGAAYTALVARGIARQDLYKPVFEDWLFHVLLPMAAYLLLLAASSLAAFALARASLFLVGAAVLLLLFIGIHNAWDAIAYHVLVRRPQAGQEEKWAGAAARA